MNKVEPDGGASELQLGSEVRAAVAVNADVELGTRVGGDTDTELLLPKRPAEKAPQETLGRAEVASLVKQGRKENDATVLGAGFLGGDGVVAIRSWIAIGAVGGIASLVLIASLINGSEGGDDSSFSNNDASLSIIMLLNLILGVGSFARAYFLHKKQHRKALNTLGYMAIGIGSCMTGYSIAMVYPCLHTTIIFTGLGLCIAVPGVLLLNDKLKEASNFLFVVAFMQALIPLSLLACEGEVAKNLFICASLFAVFGFLVYQRLASLRKADAMVKADSERYDAVWNTFADGNAITINAIDTVLQGCQAEASLPKQKLRRYVAQARLTLTVAKNAAGTSKPRQHIDDLFVLFNKAHALNDHFQAMVDTWARPLAELDDEDGDGGSSATGRRWVTEARETIGGTTHTSSLGVVVHSCPPKRLGKKMCCLERKRDRKREIWENLVLLALQNITGERVLP